MKCSIGLVIVMLLSALTLPSPAQEHRQGQRIVTRTRLQVVFGELEGQWLKAIRDKDEAALNRVLADGFEVWTAAPPGSPTPRADWQPSAFASKLESFGMRQLGVRAVSPDVSVAHFVLTETFDQGGKPRTEEYFVVDVWTKVGEGDNWRCTDRYLSKLSMLSHPISAKPSVKPDGKN